MTREALRRFVDEVVLAACARDVAVGEVTPHLLVTAGDEISHVVFAMRLDIPTKNGIATLMRLLVAEGAEAIVFVAESWRLTIPAAEQARFDAWRAEDPARPLAAWPGGGVTEHVQAHAACREGVFVASRQIVEVDGGRRLHPDTHILEAAEIEDARFLRGLAFTEARLSGQSVHEILRSLFGPARTEGR